MTCHLFLTGEIDNWRLENTDFLRWFFNEKIWHLFFPVESSWDTSTIFNIIIRVLSCRVQCKIPVTLDFLFFIAAFFNQPAPMGGGGFNKEIARFFHTITSSEPWNICEYQIAKAKCVLGQSRLKRDFIRLTVTLYSISSICDNTFDLGLYA